MNINEINTINTNIVVYKLIKEMCIEWLELEQKLNPIAKEDDIVKFNTVLWYNIINANLFDLKSLDKTFNLMNKDTLILTRISQLYIQIICVIGTEGVKDLHKKIDDTLKEFGISNYKDYSKKYPFIVLIPILNDISKTRK